MHVALAAALDDNLEIPAFAIVYRGRTVIVQCRGDLQLEQRITLGNALLARAVPA